MGVKGDCHMDAKEFTGETRGKYDDCRGSGCSGSGKGSGYDCGCGSGLSNGTGFGCGSGLDNGMGWKTCSGYGAGVGAGAGKGAVL